MVARGSGEEAAAAPAADWILRKQESGPDRQEKRKQRKHNGNEDEGMDDSEETAGPLRDLVYQLGARMRAIEHQGFTTVLLDRNH
eukprot:2364532-Pyramimonas_sp.AAC.1